MSFLVDVNFGDLPNSFKQSRIYKSQIQLNIDDTKVVFKLFDNVCNFDLKMNNYTTLCSALETIRYWNFENTPECFYNAILCKKTIIRDIIILNEYDLVLRFQTLVPFAEMCALTMTKPDEFMNIALNLKLYKLIAFLSPNE